MASMLAMAGQPVRCQQQVFKSQRGASRIQCSGLPQHRQEQQQLQQPWELRGVKHVTIGLAAAIMLHSSPATAGVILEERTLKKVFQSEPVQAVQKEAAKIEAAVTQQAPSSAPSLPSLPNPAQLTGNLPLLTLPLAIGGIFVGALAWRAIDPGFARFFDAALVKNSNSDGAGYELADWRNGGPSQSKKKSASWKVSTGTKKVAKKAASKGEANKKKGLFSF